MEQKVKGMDAEQLVINVSNRIHIEQLKQRQDGVSRGGRRNYRYYASQEVHDRMALETSSQHCGSDFNSSIHIPEVY